MRRFQIVTLLLLAIGICTTPLIAQEVTEEPSAEATEVVESETSVLSYTVQAGDNLYRIALQFGLTTDELAEANGITNPGLVYPGQQLIIPGNVAPNDDEQQSQPTATPVPETTAEPTDSEQDNTMESGIYVVQPGDNLYRIALKHNTTMAELMQLNNITNQDIIYVGQTLIVPGSEDAATTDTSSSDNVVLDTLPVEDAEFAYGIEVYGGDPNMALAAQQVEQLGMNWIKIRVSWRELEATEGQINFAGLDNTIDALQSTAANIMFTVTSAPQWARTSTEEDGPPDDLAKFATFIEALATHYNGQVDAYQIWDEPNLRRNWNCTQRMCDTNYLEMLETTYAAIKSVDVNAIVVTAGLAPTGFNDRVNAIDDRLFLETLYANGVTDVSDAIGIHPGGFANPPDASCCVQSNGVLTHYEDSRFYFKDNLAAYRSIMVKYGDEDTALWVTKFGWGSSEDTDSPREINIFVSYTSLTEQAIYAPRAFEIGNELGYIGPMFLDNLNGCQSKLALVEICYSALISPNGQPRPVFNAVAGIEKSPNHDN